MNVQKKMRKSVYDPVILDGVRVCCASGRVLERRGGEREICKEQKTHGKWGREKSAGQHWVSGEDISTKEITYMYMYIP